MAKAWQGRITRGVFCDKSIGRKGQCDFCKQPIQKGDPVFHILKRRVSGRLIPFIRICEPCSERTIQETGVIQALMD